MHTCGGNSSNGGIGTSPLISICPSVVYGWSLGQKSFSIDASTNAGIPLSRNTNSFLIVEIHYNNPTLDRNVFDSTRMDLVITSDLREHDAGMFAVGVNNGFEQDPIPAGSSEAHLVASCPGECTSWLSKSINVIASFLHMHSFGKKIWTTVYDSEMNFKQVGNQIDYWNIDFQQFTQLSYVINPGDNLFTHCTYDTSKWPSDIKMKEGGLDEMCIDFLLYYPVQQNNGKTLMACGGISTYGLGTKSFVKDTKYESYSDLILSEIYKENPQYKSMMLGSACRSVDGFEEHNEHKETITVLGTTMEVPVQRFDYQSWNAASKKFEPPVQKKKMICDIDKPSGSFDLDGILNFKWEASDSCKISFELRVQGDRWVAFGLGDKMANSKLVIGKGSNSGNGVGEYTIDSLSRTMESVVLVSENLAHFEWELENGNRILRGKLGSIVGSSLSLPGCGGSSTTDKMVFAYGSSIEFAQHESTGVTTIDWSQSGSSDVETNMKLQAHAFLMTIAFCVILPFGMLFPIWRPLESSKPGSWFLWHRIFISVAFVSAIAAFICGLLFVNVHFTKPHHWIGLVVMVLFLANPIVGMLRPHEQTSQVRKRWLLIHRIIGYGSLFGGMVNCIIGASIIPAAYYFHSQSVLGASLAVGFGLLVVGCASLIGWKTKSNLSQVLHKEDSV